MIGSITVPDPPGKITSTDIEVISPMQLSFAVSAIAGGTLHPTTTSEVSTPLSAMITGAILSTTLIIWVSAIMFPHTSLTRQILVITNVSPIQPSPIVVVE